MYDNFYEKEKTFHPSPIFDNVHLKEVESHIVNKRFIFLLLDQL